MILAIIQARLGSKRLPEKVIADIQGKPMLLHIIERVKHSALIDKIVMATTREPHDQILLQLASQWEIEAFAGSSTDVLDRFYQVASYFSPDIIVRITADDPLKDPYIMNKIVNKLIKHPDINYASNTIEPTFPEGLDIEAFTFETLEKAWINAQLKSEREHVTPYIWKNSNKFQIKNVKYNKNLSFFRWTVDYPEDLCFIRNVYSRLYKGQIFFFEDVLSLLKKEPALMQINRRKVLRNEGYINSLLED